MPFEFELNGVPIAEASAPMLNLSVVRDSLRHMSPQELAAWIQAKPHCV